jgi:hypothetical protein
MGYSSMIAGLADGRVVVCDGKRCCYRWAEIGDRLPRVPRHDDLFLTDQEEEDVNMAVLAYLPTIREDVEKVKKMKNWVNEYFDEEWPNWKEEKPDTGPRTWTVRVDDMEVTFADWGGGGEADNVAFDITLAFDDGHAGWQKRSGCNVGFGATRGQLKRIARIILDQLDGEKET